jgi:hypothetical protein
MVSVPGTPAAVVAPTANPVVMVGCEDKSHVSWALLAAFVHASATRTPVVPAGLVVATVVVNAGGMTPVYASELPVPTGAPFGVTVKATVATVAFASPTRRITILGTTTLTFTRAVAKAIVPEGCTPIVCSAITAPLVKAAPAATAKKNFENLVCMNCFLVKVEKDKELIT